jgi:hypothetical protein
MDSQYRIQTTNHQQVIVLLSNLRQKQTCHSPDGTQMI